MKRAEAAVLCATFLFVFSQLAFGAPRFEPYQNGNRRPGSDPQHNIGSTVTNPALSGQITAEKPQAGHEPEKIQGDSDQREQIALPRSQRESDIPSIETDLPNKNGTRASKKMPAK